METFFSWCGPPAWGARGMVRPRDRPQSIGPRVVRPCHFGLWRSSRSSEAIDIYDGQKYYSVLEFSSGQKILFIFSFVLKPSGQIYKIASNLTLPWPSRSDQIFSATSELFRVHTAANYVPNHLTFAVKNG
jgi:hypothetical protein